MLLARAKSEWHSLDIAAERINTAPLWHGYRGSPHEPNLFSIENVDTFPSSRMTRTTRGSRDKYIAPRDENKPASVFLMLIGTPLISRPRKISFAHIAKIYCSNFGEHTKFGARFRFFSNLSYFKRIISLTVPVNNIIFY